MQKYSVFNLIKNAFTGHKDWKVAWKDPTPKSEYDVIIIGGGGHGLATAYYLAKRGITNVAVLDKGYIGGGNSGRNTAILRANYRTVEGVNFYKESLKLYEDLAQELNFNLFTRDYRLVRVVQVVSGLVLHQYMSKDVRDLVNVP